MRADEGSDRTAVRTSDRLVSIAPAVVLLHAIDSWLLETTGGASVAARAMRLGILAAACAVPWFAWRSFPGRRARAAILLLVGTVGLVEAAAITLPHLRDGIGGSGLSGLAACAASAFLFGLGWVRVVRLRPWWRPVLGVVLTLLIADLLLFPVAFGVYAANAPHPPLGSRTPSDVGLRFEDLRLRSADGTSLGAWYVPSENGAAILLLPGSGSTRDDLLTHASMLARGGYGLLLLDPRGHGGSGGEPMELGWGSDGDIRAAIDELARRPDVDPGRIGVLGLSMGGEQAITGAATDARIRAVVADGASARTYEDARNDPAIAGGSLSVAWTWLETEVADLLADASPPLPLADAMCAIAPRPVLLIAASPHDETEAASFYAAVGGANVEVWHVPDAAHVSAILEHPGEYSRRVFGFFDRALGAPSIRP
jgi:uncharacterized protein